MADWVTVSQEDFDAFLEEQESLGILSATVMKKGMVVYHRGPLYPHTQWLAKYEKGADGTKTYYITPQP